MRGEIFAPEFFVAPLLDSKFNVDCDFAINHDSIQSDDWVIDFLPCLNHIEPPNLVSYLEAEVRTIICM